MNKLDRRIVHGARALSKKYIGHEGRWPSYAPRAAKALGVSVDELTMQEEV